MIGLGRMGANMAQRLVRGGHRVVGFDPKRGSAQGASRRRRRIGRLARRRWSRHSPAPRTLWLMVPAGEITDATVNALLPLLAAGDTVVDGGNSNYKDTLRRAGAVADTASDYVDCGTSGGVWGLAEGYSLMIGGDEDAVERLRPIFETLAPAKDQGWGRVGPVGVGPLHQDGPQRHRVRTDAGVCRGLFDPRAQAGFRLDLHQVAEIWRYGSVVRSWLLDLTADALRQESRAWTASRRTWPIPAKAAGRSPRRSTSTCRRR